jgi:opacity protein-like surface antigen
MKRFSLCRVAAAGAAGLALSSTAHAQSWEYAITGYAWMSGLESSLETPAGTVTSDLSFGDVLDRLDLALYATVEARNGPWVLIGDVNYADLGSRIDRPVGAAFSGATIDTTLLVLSGFGGYAIVDRPDLRLEVGGGVRYYDVSVDARLTGNGAVADRRFDLSEGWADPILGVHLRAPLGERWFARAFADAGGFGIENTSDLSWQVYAGGGYEINQTWAVEFGYRHLSIDKSIDDINVEIEESGPLLGVTARF